MGERVITPLVLWALLAGCSSPAHGAAGEGDELLVAVLPSGDAVRYLEESNNLCRSFVATAMRRSIPKTRFVDHQALGSLVPGGLAASIAAGDSSAVSRIREAGVRLLLFLDVAASSEESPHGEVDNKTAHEWSLESKRWVSRPVSVSIVKQRAAARYEVNYRLVDALDGSILDATRETKEASDQVEYATCDCKQDMLFVNPAPATQNLGGALAGLLLGQFERFKAPFDARSELHGSKAMLLELTDNASSELVERLAGFFGRTELRRERALPVPPAAAPAVVQPQAMPEPPPPPKPPAPVVRACPATILRVVGGVVTLDIGENAGLKPGRRVRVFNSARDGRAVGAGYVTEVLSRTSTVLIESESGTGLQRGMCVRLVR